MAMRQHDDATERAVMEALVKHGDEIAKLTAESVGERIETLKSREAAIHDAFSILHAWLLDQKLTGSAELLRLRLGKGC